MCASCPSPWQHSCSGTSCRATGCAGRCRPCRAADGRTTSPPAAQVVKKLWTYIKENNLQNPANKTKIVLVRHSPPVPPSVLRLPTGDGPP